MQARLRVQRAEMTTLRGKAKLAKMKMRLMQIKSKMKAKIKRAEIAAHRAHAQLAKMKIKYAKLAKQTRTNIKAVIRAAVVKVQKAQLHAAKQHSMKDLKKDLLKHMQVMVTKRLKENGNRRVAADKSLTHLQKTIALDNPENTTSLSHRTKSIIKSKLWRQDFINWKPGCQSMPRANSLISLKSQTHTAIQRG